MDKNSTYTLLDLAIAVSLAAFLGWLAVAGPFIVSNTSMWPLFAIFGLPIAFIACWMVGAPILWWVMHNPISWVAAACWGALISCLMAALWLTINESMTRNLTWWVLGQGTALFVLEGAVIALIVRGVVHWYARKRLSGSASV